MMGIPNMVNYINALFLAVITSFVFLEAIGHLLKHQLIP